MRRIVLLLLLFGVIVTIHRAFADETEGVRFSLDAVSTTAAKPTEVILPALTGWKLVLPYQHQGTLHAKYERDSMSGWANLRVKVRPCDDGQMLHGNPNTALGRIFLDEKLGTLTGDMRLTDGVLRAAYRRRDRSSGMIAARIASDPRVSRYLVTVIGEWPTNSPKTYAQDHETLTRLIRLE